MKILVPSKLTKSQKSEIDKFVSAHPRGNIFHTSKMFQVYENTKNYVPFVFIALENYKIKGVLVSVIQKEISGKLGFFTSRCIVLGGPIAENNDNKIVEQLLKQHNITIRSKAIYSQFRNLFDIDGLNKTFEKAGFNYIPHLDIHINLNTDKERFWDQLKSKTRQKVRKAQKNNLKFSTINSIEELHEAYNILKEVYSRARLPIPDRSLFVSAFKLLNNENNTAFFKAEKDGTMIGVRFVLLYNRLIYDWFAGSKREYYKYNTNEFLPYKVIEWGMDNSDYDMFDFGGAGNPNENYGVRDHKMQFSDNLIELGRFEKIHYPLLYKFIKTGFRFWQKIRK